MKMMVYATKIQTFQKFSATYLAQGAILVFPNAAIQSPIETRDIIPLILIPKSTYSATKYRIQQETTVIFKVRMGSFLTLLISWAERYPKSTPKTIAPTVSSRKSCTIFIGGGLCPFTNQRLIVNNTMQLPSLNKLSPSISELNFLGAPASLSKAKTATVSVHESTEPNINASDQLQQVSSYPMMALMETIITSAPTSTDGKARIKICTDCFLKMYQSELNELSKIRGGKKMSSMPRGSMQDICFIDYPITPVLSQVQPSPTLMRNNVGVYGTQEYIALSFFIMTATVRPKNKKRSANASGLTLPSIMVLRFIY